MFVDNSGADVVLGMLPLARELARCGCQVLLAANEVGPHTTSHFPPQPEPLCQHRFVTVV